MTTFFIVVATIYGLVIGSFLNAVIYRVPRKESLNTRSHCPRCDAGITAKQNIPVVSWLMLRGKCANCHEPIAKRYPAVELAGALSYGVATAYFANSLVLDTTPKVIAILGLLWLVAASIALSLIDIELQLLPNAIVYPTLAVIVATLTTASLLEGNFDQLIRSFVGLAALGGLYGGIWLWKPGAMGFGDVRLSLIVGFVAAWFSYGSLIIAGFSAFLLAGIFGIAGLMLAKAGRKTMIPFGPWMLLGMWIGIVWGEHLFDMYLRLGGLS